MILIFNLCMYYNFMVIRNISDIKCLKFVLYSFNIVYPIAMSLSYVVLHHNLDQCKKPEFLINRIIPLVICFLMIIIYFVIRNKVRNQIQVYSKEEVIERDHQNLYLYRLKIAIGFYIFISSYELVWNMFIKSNGCDESFG